jgi:hypothetical protein
MTERHTITIDHNAYQRLKRKGIFGETYSRLILRLVKLAEVGSSSLEEEKVNND